MSPFRPKSSASIAIICASCAIWLAGWGVAADTASRPPSGKIDFIRDIQPILASHCYECHGPVTARGKLRWDRRDSVLKRKEAPYLPGKSAESLLIEVVTSKDAETVMPPEGKGQRLTAAEVKTLREWIDQGATWPDEAAIGPDIRLDH